MRPRLRAAIVAGVMTLGLAAPSGAGADTEVLSFPAEADTYVDESAPATSFGESSGFWVDASPRRHAFLRFWALGLAGRQVTGARLHLTQRDASRSGGRISAMSANDWTESATWNTRPSLGSGPVGSFGSVSSDLSYSAALATGSVREGVVSLGLDSPSSDGARWGSVESPAPPRLEIAVESPPGFVADGPSLVAGAKSASSEPTYTGTNRRLALSSGGRLLAVHGSHLSGLQLAWRDPAGGWQTRTTGAVADGGVLTGTGTGDWSASIAVARDAAGTEQAWVVWSGRSHSGLRAVRMRRLSRLDDPAGPRVGPVVTVDAPELGAYRADVAFEHAPDGTVRGTLLWTRRVDSTFELVSAWFAPIGSDTPAVRDQRVLTSDTSAARFGTLVPAARGMRVVARGPEGALTLYAHAAGDPLTTWSRGASGPVIDSASAPSAVALDSGEVLVAVERDTSADVTSLHRFSASGGSVASELTLSGLSAPTIASDGSLATVVGVRAGTGHLVSRRRAATGGWSASDRLEVGAEARAPLKYPNALRETDGRLRLVAEGPDGSATQSSVLAFQRPF